MSGYQPLTNSKGRVMRLLLCLMAATLSAPSFSQQDENKDLEELQQQIKKKQQFIESNIATVKTLQQQLKKEELLISASAKKLDQTNNQLAENQREQKSLNSERKTLQKKQQQQESVLEKQLRSAYMAGNHDYAKMIFNLESASKFERLLTYYQYLNAERKQQIDAFKALSQQLVAVEKQLADKQQQLQSLRTTELAQQTQLASQQNARKITLNELNKRINTEAEQVEQLQINEQSLLQALTAAAEEVQNNNPQQVELLGLANFKGKLKAPVSGTLRKLFGNRRTGQVRWKGIIIYGNEGAPVKAIQNAQVLYADWLEGFGLVIALNHGDGYMSLYGHNQALLKGVGESVSQGESIALVGQSGGQSRPSLYFEIRHKGNPVNPSAWLVR